MNFGDNVQIKGCAVKGRHLESSSGNSSIDSLIGGALPNTSITFVDETQSRVYADTLVKYFIAEGLYNDHDILVADPCGSSSDIWTSIPSRSESTDAPTSGRPMPPGDEERMKIAWRYGATPQMNSAIGSKNRYDLRKPIENLSSFGSVRRLFPSANDACSYGELFTTLDGLLKSDVYSKSRGPKKNLLRVVIKQIGSPLWADHDVLSLFLARLQMMTRSSYVLVMCTTCSTSLQPTTVREMEMTSDLFIRLVAMTDEEKKLLPSLDKFHGYFHLVRLPRLTSVSTHCPAAVDLVFELHRKSFDVKVLHLPPALGDSDLPKKGACGADF